MSQVEEYRKKLSKMNKQQLIDFSLKTLTTPDEKEGELLEGVEEVIPEVYQELAKQLGGNVSDDQIPVMTELNPRQIYALAGLLCTLSEDDPNWNPIRDFAYWFMTLQISNKRKSRNEVMTALMYLGKEQVVPFERPGRLTRLKRWITGE